MRGASRVLERTARRDEKFGKASADAAKVRTDGLSRLSQMTTKTSFLAGMEGNNPELPAPQLVMLANVALTAEGSSSDYLSEDKQMAELQPVGSNSYSDSEDETVVRYSYEPDSAAAAETGEYASGYATQDLADLDVGTQEEESKSQQSAEDLSTKAPPLPPSPQRGARVKRKCVPQVAVVETTKKKKPFHCKPCQYQAQCEEEFVQHIRMHSAKKLIIVKGGSEETSGEAAPALPSSVARAGSTNGAEGADGGKGVIRCERCGYNTNRYDHYMAHLKHHSKEGKDQRVYKCTICTYTTISQYHWKKHLRNHFPSKLFTCSQCCYFSDRKNNYIQHIRTHTGERPFRCLYCDYSSSQKTHLTRHMRTHSGERPFKCDSCSYLAANQHEVTRHARQVHNGPKPLSCPYCEYKTADRSNFKKHVELHVNPRQFLCPVCKYAASKKCNLQYHIKSRHPGCSDITMDVSKVKLRVKKPGVEDLSPTRTNTPPVLPRIREVPEVVDGDSNQGPINLSTKTSSKHALSVITVGTQKEKSPKKPEEPSHKKTMPKKDKEAANKKAKGRDLVKNANEKQRRMDEVEAKKDKGSKRTVKAQKYEESVKPKRCTRKKATSITTNAEQVKEPIIDPVIQKEKELAEKQTREKEILERKAKEKEEKERQRKELEEQQRKEKERLAGLEKQDKENKKASGKPPPKRTPKKLNTPEPTLAQANEVKAKNRGVKRKADVIDTGELEKPCSPGKAKRRTSNFTKKVSTPDQPKPSTSKTKPSKKSRSAVTPNKPEKMCKGASKELDQTMVDKDHVVAVSEKESFVEEAPQCSQLTQERPSTDPEPPPQSPSVACAPVLVPGQGVEEPHQAPQPEILEEPELTVEKGASLEQEEEEVLKKAISLPERSPERDSGMSEPPTPSDGLQTPTLVLPRSVQKPSDAEEDEGIHSHDGGSDISDSASERSDDSGLRGRGKVAEPETPTEELPSPTTPSTSKLQSHTCIFCDRTFSQEVDYRRHLNRHLVNVYFLEGTAPSE
ncbi:RE1-silencing transcription factor [Denticeps clupeoides]|uniref:C2H2-type domain-containing protein n=1 Tax=Denticeps clupeoides TaxID=299321 RepID=A0AAY4CAN5_9TELE|nr:RE1-silencing transcription factor [Denticeps clupeoides]